MVSVLVFPFGYGSPAERVLTIRMRGTVMTRQIRFSHLCSLGLLLLLISLPVIAFMPSPPGSRAAFAGGVGAGAGAAGAGVGAVVI